MPVLKSAARTCEGPAYVENWGGVESHYHRFLETLTPTA
jgi:hypothetical protein